MIDKEGRLRRIDYGGRIFYDDLRGIAGTTYPIGTAGMPSNTIADAITMLAARNLKALDVHGAVTFAVDLNHKDFFGNYHESVADIVTLAAGNDVDDSHFEGLIVTGAQGGTLLTTYKECLLLNMTGFRGLAENCVIYGTLAIATGGAADYADFDHCTSVHGAITVTIGAPDRVSFKEFSGGMILTAQTAGAVLVRGISGYLEVDAMTGGTLDIYAHGAEIQINADCIGAGVINIYGDARVTDLHGAGTTVNDYTKETQLDAIEGAKVVASGTAAAGSDADTLVDAGRAEGDDYWNGLTLLMLTGNNAGLTRPIVDFTDAGDTMELRPAFPAAIAVGDTYVILSNYHELVPGIDSAENYLPRDALGNKEDTALQAATAADSLMRYVKGLLLGQSRQLFTMDFWSDTQEELQVTSGATTETLPSVTIADLPGTIVRAIAMFKFRMVENTYAGINAINVAQHIQVQKAAGTWRDAISIADTLFTFAEAAREGGDVLIGDHNIVVEVDANAVYNFQWLNADSLQDFIQYNDIQVGLRIWYSV